MGGVSERVVAGSYCAFRSSGLVICCLEVGRIFLGIGRRVGRFCGGRGGGLDRGGRISLRGGIIYFEG